MAARAFLDLIHAAPVRNFATMLADSHVSQDRPNLHAAAIRNSYGRHYVDQSSNAVVPVPMAPHVQAAPLQPALAQIATEPVRAMSSPVVTPIVTLDLPATARAKALDWQRRQQALVTTTNWRLPTGSSVTAWSILPLHLFQGELGRFLILACDFYAHGPSNTMLLPTMPGGEQQLALPRYPSVVSDKHLNASRQQLSALRDRVAAEHSRAQLALQTGDLSAIYARTDSKAKYCKELVAITNDIANAQLGRGIVATHNAHFGAMIARM